jgi:predicted nucleotidyltransferase
MEFRPRRVIDGAETVEVAGKPVRLIAVDDLIAMKRAAGRPKDMETAAELEALKGLQEHE